MAVLNFSVTPDPCRILNRSQYFREWQTTSQLDEFRESGPSDDLFDLVKRLRCE